MPFPTYDKQEDVPEPFRSSYLKASDGKWAVDDSSFTSGLKDSQRRLLDEKKKAEDDAAALRSAIGNRKPEEVAKLLKDLETADDDKARKAGDFDKLLEKRVNEAKSELQKQIDELSPYRKKFEDRELEAAIRDAAAKAGVIADDMRLVIPIVKGSRVKLDEKTGKPVVLDADGDVTGLTVEKFFSETFKAEAPKFYAAAGGSGGGAGGGSGNRTAGTGSTISASDDKGFLANLDKIAKGEVKVA